MMKISLAISIYFTPAIPIYGIKDVLFENNLIQNGFFLCSLCARKKNPDNGWQDFQSILTSSIVN